MISTNDALVHKMKTKRILGLFLEVIHKKLERVMQNDRMTDERSKRWFVVCM